MKVGDYLRLEDGIITRFGGSDFEKIINGHYINCAVEYFHTKKIIKSSPNIIDLIEIGDYVNGIRIDEIDEKGLYNYNSYDGWSVNVVSANEEIKSIVTKEQFESCIYKVGE